MNDLIYLILLLLSDFFLIFTLIYIHRTQKKNQLIASFNVMMSLLILWCTVLIVQILAIHNMPNIQPVYFDYIVYISTCFFPVVFFFLSLIFAKTSIEFKPAYLLLTIIPIISLIVLWTNDFHHLFYVHYSTVNTDTVFGNYFIVHSLYTYILLLVSIYFLVKYSIKNSGLFSRQSVLIIIGILVPLVVNIIGFLGLEMSIYVTPILFTITALCFALAIFKFGFLSIAPIALQKIVDRMSDGYIVLNTENSITDFNETFLKMFHFTKESIRGKNIFELNTINPRFSFDISSLKQYLEAVRTTDKTFKFEIKLNNSNNYYNVEINNIRSNSSIIGTLILFKDITQHMDDLNIIQDKQNMLMEKERLASLGQLIGGIAHNLKTPIMSISGATEGLNDLIKEYDASIDDPEVNSKDHHDIAKDMFTWVSKIKTHTEYMSDVITAVKGQAVTLSNEDDISFTVEELLKRVNILMKHELKNAIIYLNVKMKADENIVIHGDVNSLVQVINNMISNSIQAYEGKTDESIDLIVEEKDKNLILSIQDYASGIPKKVQEKLFKEMITTKGKNGTGLGLYMSYSTIKAHFNGNITLESVEGKGTTFTITLPI